MSLESFFQDPMRALYILFEICIAALILLILFSALRKYRIKQMITALANNAAEMTPQEFMEMRRTSLGGRGHKSIALSMNYVGVYILHNKTRNLYYVGQGKQVLNRVNAHFTGHGNGDVYADYKHGDSFTIRTIALANSGFASLNELERYAIEYYDAYRHGYNKTRGNRG